MIVAGKFIYNTYHVCFHFVRNNIYSPWRTIGILVTQPLKYEAIYVKEYRDYQQAFYDEFDTIDNMNVAASYEALDNYRKRYHQPFDVLSPVIRYHSLLSYDETPGIAERLNLAYVDNTNFRVFKVLAYMIKMKDAYFAILRKTTKIDTKAVVDGLIAAGYIEP